MLLEAQIGKAATPDRLKKLSDGGGLQLWLMPSGAKLWRFCYRFDAQQRAMKLGAYPETGLKAARMMRDHARGELANGRDPAPQMPTVRPGEATFGMVAAEWREKLVAEKRAPATLERNDFLLSHALPYLGERPVADIEPTELLTVLRRVATLGRHESAARLRMVMSAIFRHAVATGHAKVDPAAPLKGALARPKATPRAAITDPTKFGQLLGMIDGFDGSPMTKAALKLLSLLACRPGELRLAEWREFDLSKKLWIIPVARTKTRREHRMHLAPQVVEILRGLKSLMGDHVFLFPALNRTGRTMSENTINAALRTMGVSGAEHCAHGFRSSFSTIANESGKFRSDVIERHLAHEDKSPVRAIYNRSELWPERVVLADWWANECRDMATLWG